MKEKELLFYQARKGLFGKGIFCQTQIKGRRELRSGNQLARFKDCQDDWRKEEGVGLGGSRSDHDRKFLCMLPFPRRELESCPAVFSRGVIGSDFFCKRLILTQSEITEASSTVLYHPKQQLMVAYTRIAGHDL